jgi:hypothetical protein
MKRTLTIVAVVGAIALMSLLSSCSTSTSSESAGDAQSVRVTGFDIPLTAEEAAQCAALAKGGEGVQADVTYEAHLCPDVTVSGSVSNTDRSNVSEWKYYSFNATAGNEVTITVNNVSSQMDPAIYVARGTTTTTTGVNFNVSFFRGGSLTYLGRTDNGGCGQSESYTFTPSVTGSYTVMVFRIALSVCSTGTSFDLTVEGCDSHSGCVADSDGDGVPDNQDSYPNSNMSAKVNIDGCNSNVANSSLGGGATMMDKILECAANAANHGQFVSCVNGLTNTWKQAGLITNQQKNAISNCASQSSLP